MRRRPRWRRRCFCPPFLTVLLLALQPVCVLYTQGVMENAASETARLLATSTADREQLVAFAEKRLSAVPDLEIFHTGGPRGWDVQTSGGAAGGVYVSIRGKVRPLPVLGAFVRFGRKGQDGLIELEVSSSYASSPEWKREAG